jgi:hypothetical protein
LKELVDHAAVGQGDLLDRHLEPRVIGVDDPPREGLPRFETLDLQFYLPPKGPATA